MPIDFVSILNGTDPVIWMVAKGFYVVAFVLYLIFSVIAWKQIGLMARTLNGAMELPLKLVGLMVFLLALGGLGVALIVL